MKKHIAIINPLSGNYFRRKHNQKWIELLKNNVDVELHYTEYARHGGHIAKTQYEKGIRSFLIFGGDGTIFDVVNGLYPSALKNPPSIGIIPSGTGNSMLKDFSPNIESTLDAVFSNQTKNCDVIKLVTSEQDIFYTNLASIGFVAQVGQVRNKYFSWMGHLGYVAAVLCWLPFFAKSIFTISMDQKDYHAPWVFLSFNNTRFTGGNMMIAPHAIVDDGKIAVTTVESLSKASILCAFPKIFKGTHINLQHVQTLKAQNIFFHQMPKQPIMIDGELLHLTPQTMQVHQQALKVYAL